MTYAELLSILEPAGYPVAMPGETNVALPAFTVNPLGIEMDELYPVAYEVAEISARVVLDENNPAHWDEARRMIYLLFPQFRGTEITFDPDIVVTTDSDSYPASIAYTITVQFPGDPYCEPTTLLVTDDTVAPDLTTYLTA